MSLDHLHKSWLGYLVHYVPLRTCVGGHNGPSTPWLAKMQFGHVFGSFNAFTCVQV